MARPPVKWHLADNITNAEVNFQVRQKSARILSGLAHSYFLSEPDQLRLIQVFRSRIRRKMKKSLKSKSPAKRRFVHEDIAGDKAKLLVSQYLIYEGPTYESTELIPTGTSQWRAGTLCLRHCIPLRCSLICAGHISRVGGSPSRSSAHSQVRPAWTICFVFGM